MKIRTTKKDIIWNYVGTIVSASSGFILLPFQLAFLSSDELGLWYIFMAVSNLSMLLEWSFDPTMARNIVYVLSGAKRLNKKGVTSFSDSGDVDWHLLKVVMMTTKIIFAVISIVTFAIVVTFGTVYVSFISKGVSPMAVWTSWGIFCIAIFLNLFFLYSVTYLRGFGDVAGENRSKTVARVVQLCVSAFALFAGAGLVGAAFGYLLNGVVMRLVAARALRRHSDVLGSLAARSEKIMPSEIKDAFSNMSYIAFRDICVQFSSYITTQATTIVCSLFLSLSETGTYSLLLQLGNALCNMAAAYIRSYTPAFQSAFSRGDLAAQRRIVGRGTVAYWLLIPAGMLLILLIAFPILPLFKKGFHPDVALFVVICIYLALLNQHSVYCNLIVSMNEIPYVVAYIISAISGILLSAGLLVAFDGHAMALIAGQGLAQLAYNNWKWPAFVARRLGISYWNLLLEGLSIWRRKIIVCR